MWSHDCQYRFPTQQGLESYMQQASELIYKKFIDWGHSGERRMFQRLRSQTEGLNGGKGSGATSSKQRGPAALGSHSQHSRPRWTVLAVWWAKMDPFFLKLLLHFWGNKKTNPHIMKSSSHIEMKMLPQQWRFPGVVLAPCCGLCFSICLTL